MLSILVIFTHAFNTRLFLEEEGTFGAAAFTETLISEKIAQIAVPGFFMISSCLFFRNYDFKKTKRKWARRCTSVLIPYFLWNIIYYFGYVIASRIPVLTDIVGKGIVVFSLPAFFKAALEGTYNVVFWFVFQLILLILLSPFLYILVRNKAAGAVLCFCLLIPVAYRTDILYVNYDALFYYTFAAWLSVHFKEALERECLTEREKRKSLCAGFLLILVSAVLYSVAELNRFADSYSDLFVVLSRTCGVGGLWVFLSGIRLPAAKSFMKNSFLVYAVHFALVRLINKTADCFFHGSTSAALVLYFLMPAIILSVMNAVAAFDRKHTPILYRLLTGSR